MTTAEEDTVLWSVRMHASFMDDGSPTHVSGAERLVSAGQINPAVDALLGRAFGRGADTIQITAEKLADRCTHVPCLPVLKSDMSPHGDPIGFARRLLVTAGVDEVVSAHAIDALIDGFGHNRTPIRGASLWDLATGERLEPDRERGVRTSRFDYSQSGAVAVDSALAEAGLNHFRTREALAVATKTLWAGIAAELCWSDEPEYDTGYVATPALGYVRIRHFKPSGAVGGRIFFVDRSRSTVNGLMARLERAPVLIDPPVSIRNFDCI